MATIKLINCFILFFIVGIANSGLANNYTAINYTITPIVTTNTPYIKVTAEIKGELAGKVIVDLPSVWANVNHYKQIKNIKLNHPQGKIQFKKNNNHKNSNQAIITTPKTNSIILNYEVHQHAEDIATVTATIVRKNLVHTTGYGIFVIPNDLKNTKNKTSFNIKWENIPAKWQTISSHGREKFLKFTTNVHQLLHAIYIAGNLRIYQIIHANNYIYLSLYGNFSLADALITSSLKEIIKTQRIFFNDNDFPYYAISLIAGSDPYSRGGTWLHNSCAAYFPKVITRLTLYTLLAHEHLHNWIGNKISNKQGALNYWWTEGFTEYYTKILALRSGEFLSQNL